METILHDKKPIVLWFTSSYPRFKLDSASIFLRNLAENINAQNFNLHVLLPDDQDLKVSTDQTSIKLHSFKYFYPRSLQKLAYGSGILPNLKATPLLFIQIPFFLISQFMSGLLLAKKLKPALIHAHWVFPQGTIASLIGKLLNIPVIITAHGGDAFALQTSLLAKIKCWSLNNCSAWTSNTMATGNALKGDFPKPKVIPMGIDFNKFSSGNSDLLRSTIDKETFILLFVGRLVEKKGVSDLLTAFSMLPENLSNNCQLWIIGEGTERKSLEKLAQSYSLDQKVIFWGKLDNQQLPDYYAAADLFIAPSIIDASGDTEGQGVILLEAMASGTAVISTNIGGISEIITDGETGLLTTHQTPEELKQAIVKLLQDKQLRKKLAENGKLSSQNFVWSHIADNFIHLYDKVLQSTTK